MVENVSPPLPAHDISSELSDEAFASLNARIEQLEASLSGRELDAEAQHRQLLISEVRQRIEVRNWVVVIAIVVLIFMAGILTHAAHSYFWGPFVLVPQTLAVVMFLAPIASITTISIMLLIGAFRRFKDDDVGKIDVASIAAEAIKMGQGS